MSRTATRFHRDRLTVWPITGTTQGYNTPIYGAPFTVRCNYSTDNKASVDSNGVEFIPKFVFYVTAAPGQIKRNDRVMLGIHTDMPEPSSNAEIVRVENVKRVQRGLGSPDVTVMV